MLPYEAEVVRRIHAAGVPVYTHTCGEIGDRLERMAATGIDGIDTLDPPPLGSVDLSDAKRRVGERLFFKGNIDPVNTLLRKSAKRCGPMRGGGWPSAARGEAISSSTRLFRLTAGAAGKSDRAVRGQHGLPVRRRREHRPGGPGREPSGRSGIGAMTGGTGPVRAFARARFPLCPGRRLPGAVSWSR